MVLKDRSKTHPFTQVSQPPAPLPIEKGTYVVDRRKPCGIGAAMGILEGLGGEVHRLSAVSAMVVFEKDITIEDPSEFMRVASSIMPHDPVAALVLEEDEPQPFTPPAP